MTMGIPPHNLSPTSFLRLRLTLPPSPSPPFPIPAPPAHSQSSDKAHLPYAIVSILSPSLPGALLFGFSPGSLVAAMGTEDICCGGEEVLVKEEQGRGRIREKEERRL